MTSLRSNPWLTFLALCFGFFLIMLDTTIVNIAIPSVMSDLHAGLDKILWILNGYILVYATLVITAGRLGELLGLRTLYIAGLVVFVLASILCGFAQEAGQLIAARIVQGTGAALLAPQTLAIITTLFPRERRGPVFGTWSAVAGVAAITGPTLGGFIVTYGTWRWIFFVNIPIGILGLVLTLLFVPDLHPGRHRKLDLVGAALASIGLLAVVFCLIDGQRYNWGEVWGGVSIPGITIAGILTLVFFVFWERTRSEPLIPLSLFKIRNFSIINGVNVAISFGMIGMLLVVTIFLQSVLGLTALETGQTIAPLSIISMLVAPFAGRLTDKTGGKHLLIAGLLLFATEIGLIAWIGSSGLMSITEASGSLRVSGLLLLAPIILGGSGIGCVISPSTTIAMRGISPQVAGAASGVLTATRQLGYLLGSAVSGALLQSQFVSTLQAQASVYSSQVPVGFRQQFIDLLNDASKKGLYMLGTSDVLHLDLPQQVKQQFQSIFYQIFAKSFVAAVQPTSVMLIIVLVMSAVSCLAIIDDR